jgi:mannonate dehydratase
MLGEEDGEPGYTMLGRLFAYGYIRAMMHATEGIAPRSDELRSHRLRT